jgi:alanine dehydrogenase
MKVIGLPKEVKDQERRVALIPTAVATAVAAGHDVRVQAGAGVGAGICDADFKEAGAEIVSDARDVWAADVVVKVKEPRPDEYGYFRAGLTLFAYLHLAAEPELARALAAARVEAYAFETLEERGRLPLLAPMSEIAGRAAAIVGAYHLSTREGGSGTLAGGAAGALPAKAVVVGLGVAGTMAARGLKGLDASVTGIDVDLGRLYDARMEATVDATVASSPAAVAEAVADADIVIGAALVPGARAPVVVGTDHVASMRPGSVLVDLAIDQGGCIETARPTSLSDPVYVEHGVVHYCVTNVPGQFPRTASSALSAAVAPRLLALLEDPQSPRLTGSCNVSDGAIVHPVVAAAVEV